MKTTSNTASPFILLLIPVFICVGLLYANKPKDLPSDKVSVSTSLQAPSLETLLTSIF